MLAQILTGPAALESDPSLLMFQFQAARAQCEADDPRQDLLAQIVQQLSEGNRPLAEWVSLRQQLELAEEPTWQWVDWDLQASQLSEEEWRTSTWDELCQLVEQGADLSEFCERCLGALESVSGEPGESARERLRQALQGLVQDPGEEASWNEAEWATRLLVVWLRQTGQAASTEAASAEPEPVAVGDLDRSLYTLLQGDGCLQNDLGILLFQFQAARAGCPSDDFRRPTLDAVVEQLTGGQRPVLLMKKLRADLRMPEEPAWLQAEWEALADNLAPEYWQSQPYRNLVEALAKGGEDLGEFLQARRQEVEEVRQVYAAGGMISSSLGHRWLQTAMEGWAEGLELLAAGQDGLPLVEWGMRRMVALQMLQGRMGLYEL